MDSKTNSAWCRGCEQWRGDILIGAYLADGNGVDRGKAYHSWEPWIRTVGRTLPSQVKKMGIGSEMLCFDVGTTPTPAACISWCQESAHHHRLLGITDIHYSDSLVCIFPRSYIGSYIGIPLEHPNQQVNIFSIAPDTPDIMFSLLVQSISVLLREDFQIAFQGDCRL